MTDIVDHDGNRLFTENFDHQVLDAEGTAIDIIETAGNLWMSAPAVLDAMGMMANGKGDHSRRLKRIEHPDIIKISDTPFRFTDGRRNRGSFISPRAVMTFAEGGTKGFNPIMANNFTAWLSDTLLADGTVDDWSPARRAPVSVEPVFRKVVNVDENTSTDGPLDPLRPRAGYHSFSASTAISVDEVEFCICTPSHWGLGTCWCNGKGGVRSALPVPFEPYLGDDVIDDEDDFEDLHPTSFPVAPAGSEHPMTAARC